VLVAAIIITTIYWPQLVDVRAGLPAGQQAITVDRLSGMLDRLVDASQAAQGQRMVVHGGGETGDMGAVAVTGQPASDGDRLRTGDYRLIVLIERGKEKRKVV
jgi:mRNA-degrading endonuclease RelE of RelBE toxin-antitoxin system